LSGDVFFYIYAMKKLSLSLFALAGLLLFNACDESSNNDYPLELRMQGTWDLAGAGLDNNGNGYMEADENFPLPDSLAGASVCFLQDGTGMGFTTLIGLPIGGGDFRWGITKNTPILWIVPEFASDTTNLIIRDISGNTVTLYTKLQGLPGVFAILHKR
jgi:hypothetical protein